MISAFISLLGLFIGSFLGVLVVRLINGKSVVFGRSQCDLCKHKLGVMDLIPVLSFLFTKGRCRYCKEKLSIFYPFIEITTGLAFFITSYFFLYNPLLLVSILIINSLLIVVIFSDLKYGLISDRIQIALILSAPFYLYVAHQNMLINFVVGVVTFLFFFLISIVFQFLLKKESLGGADIKFAFFMGLILGFPNTILALYMAFLTAAFVAIILVIWHKKNFRGSTIPFGPFLALSVFISLFLGDKMLQLILKFLGV